MMMKDSKIPAAQNSHGHAKEFLQKLSKIWVRALKKSSPALPMTLSANRKAFKYGQAS
jgi:hypothetical protein